MGITLNKKIASTKHFLINDRGRLVKIRQPSSPEVYLLYQSILERIYKEKCFKN